MGMSASFTKLTTDELNRLIEDPEQVNDFLWQRPRDDGPSGSVDKSLDGIQFLLSAAEVPVQLAPQEMPGEPIVTGRGDVNFGLFPAEVATVAEQLAATPFEVLAPHFNHDRMNQEHVYPSPWRRDDLDYLRHNYEAMVAFFVAAAAGGAAALLAVSA
jgi:Domain of unknown function (DUF1877)